MRIEDETISKVGLYTQAGKSSMPDSDFVVGGGQANSNKQLSGSTIFNTTKRASAVRISEKPYFFKDWSYLKT